MSIPWKTLLFPWPTLVRATFAPFAAKRTSSIVRVMLPLTFAVVAVWWVTVPIHELMHAFGCVLAGGSVSELTIQPAYGGAFFALLFDFVTSGGDYAGQLKGFDTFGNDFTYLVTVSFPFLLTVFFGVWMLELASKNGNALWHGIGMVQCIVPVASAGGDYYEMGSIIFTRLIGWRPGSPEADLVRGDDIALVYERVQEAGLAHGGMMVFAGFVIGLVLLTATLDLALLFARAVRRRSPEPADGTAGGAGG